VTRTHGVPDAAGYRVGEIIEVFVIHFFSQGYQFFNGLPHCVDFLVRAPTTIAVDAFVGAFTITWTEFHNVVPPAWAVVISFYKIEKS